MVRQKVDMVLLGLRLRLRQLIVAVVHIPRIARIDLIRPMRTDVRMSVNLREGCAFVKNGPSVRKPTGREMLLNDLPPITRPLDGVFVRNLLLIHRAEEKS